MDLFVRSRFYEDITEEVEFLARRAGPDIAERWHAALDETIQQLLRHPYQFLHFWDQAFVASCLPFVEAKRRFAGLAAHSESSLPNPHPMDFKEKEFAVVEILSLMAIKKGDQPLH